MSRQTRRGFTLIELLVVIAIIAILAALIMAGIGAMRGKEYLTTTQIEIRELSVALENFKAKFTVYPPSQVTVAANAAAIDPESQRILKTIWPSLDFKSAFGASGWNLTGPVTLKGDQCLVFFLGGRHDANGCQGFATSKVNPFLPSGPGGERDQPFFKFKPNRLYKRNVSSPFYSYGDGFFKLTDKNRAEAYPCYAYFAPSPTLGYVDSHCSTMTDAAGNFPQPYKDNAGAYLNKQSYQIVSSGRDLLWGKARQWASGTGILDGAADPANGNSMDNIANFASGLLSAN